MDWRMLRMIPKWGNSVVNTSVNICPQATPPPSIIAVGGLKRRWFKCCCCCCRCPSYPSWSLPYVKTDRVSVTAAVWTMPQDIWKMRVMANRSECTGLRICILELLVSCWEGSTAPSAFLPHTSTPPGAVAIAVFLLFLVDCCESSQASGWQETQALQGLW